MQDKRIYRKTTEFEEDKYNQFHGPYGYVARETENRPRLLPIPDYAIPCAHLNLTLPLYTSGNLFQTIPCWRDVVIDVFNLLVWDQEIAAPFGLILC